MDVEGYEMKVLAGAEGFIAKHRPVIIAELNIQAQRSRGIREDSILEWVTKHNYRASELRPSRRGPLAPIGVRSVPVVGEPVGETLLVPNN
jgi:hypothetical protein